MIEGLKAKTSTTTEGIYTVKQIQQQHDNKAIDLLEDEEAIKTLGAGMINNNIVILCAPGTLEEANFMSP